MFFKCLRLEFAVHRNRFVGLILFAISLFALLSLAFYRQCVQCMPPEYRQTPSFWDVLAYAYAGTAPFDPANKQAFQLPIYYLAQYLGLLLLLGNTTAFWFEPYGNAVFTRLQRRQTWWLARCGWVVLCAAAYWAAALAAVATICRLAAAPFAVNAYTGIGVFSTVLWPGPHRAQLYTLVFAPLAAFIGVVLLQQFLELVLGSFLGVVCTLAFVVSGAFLNSTVLFCNQTMLVRFAAFVGTGATLAHTGLCAGATGLFCITAGCAWVTQKDLLGNLESNTAA